MHTASGLLFAEHPTQTLQPMICLRNLWTLPLLQPHTRLPHCSACCSQNLLPASRLLPTRNLYLEDTLLPNSYVAFMAQLKTPCTPWKRLQFFRLEAASLVSGPQWPNPWGRGGLHDH